MFLELRAIFLIFLTAYVLSGLCGFAISICYSILSRSGLSLILGMLRLILQKLINPS